jgi:hypothetical protein
MQKQAVKILCFGGANKEVLHAPLKPTLEEQAILGRVANKVAPSLAKSQDTEWKMLDKQAAYLAHLMAGVNINVIHNQYVQHLLRLDPPDLASIMRASQVNELLNASGLLPLIISLQSLDILDSRCSRRRR